MKKVNILMWIPVIGLVVGFIECFKDIGWHGERSFAEVTINGLYHGFGFVLTLAIIMTNLI